MWGDVQHRAEIQALGCSPATPCAPAVVVVVEREEVRRATGAKKGTIRTKSPLEPWVVCALFLHSNLSVLSRGSFGASPNPVLRYSQPPLALSATVQGLERLGAVDVINEDAAVRTAVKRGTK